MFRFYGKKLEDLSLKEILDRNPKDVVVSEEYVAFKVPAFKSIVTVPGNYLGLSPEEIRIQIQEKINTLPYI